MNHVKRLVAAALVVGVASTSFDALAQGPGAAAPTARAASPAGEDAREVEAREHFRRGIEFFNQADYTLALIEFDRAYELVPTYRVLFNIGQVNFQLNNYARSLAAFRRYLLDGGADVSPDRRAAVEADIASLLKRVASVHVTTNVEGVEVHVDDTPVGKTPLVEPVLVDAGQHILRFSAPGYETQSRTVVLAGRDKIDLATVMKKQTVVVVTPQSIMPSSAPMVVSWTTAGVFATTAIVTGLLSLNSQSSLEKLRDSTQYVSRGEIDGVASRAETYALVADIALAGAVVATGVALYFTLRKAPSSPAPGAEPMTATGRSTPRPFSARFTGTGLAGSF